MNDKAAGHKGITAFILPMKTKGVRTGPPDDKLGIRGSKSSQIFLDDVRLPGRRRCSARSAAASRSRCRRSTAAASASPRRRSASRAPRSRTRSRYAQQRRTFGKPIAQHQAIEFKLADMATEIDAARLLTLRAAWLKDNKQPYGKEAAMAKLYASDVANRAAREAIQIFGGNGYVTEFPVERHFRDARITEIYEGTSEIQRLVIAGLSRERVDDDDEEPELLLVVLAAAACGGKNKNDAEEGGGATIDTQATTRRSDRSLGQHGAAREDGRDHSGCSIASSTIISRCLSTAVEAGDAPKSTHGKITLEISDRAGGQGRRRSRSSSRRLESKTSRTA